MASAVEYLRSVVRVFPDYADTVLWFAPGPVAYEDAHLTKELEARMKAWENSYYAALTELFEWQKGFDVVAFDRRGLGLATSLADELGDALGVEYRNHQDGGQEAVTLRGAGEGTNPAARAAFLELSRVSRETIDHQPHYMPGTVFLRQER
ncbi:hypothetical protein [Subtercola vilae]|uniref:Uncharacterized protein n=1 Tax=Subtercola vilae TaxID=2056433 RepID=A0A4T2C218_9MICO|nr:hypothetical protein [Subtercola vilae]TIH36138.1 hypothetical protein D4765_10135 [Subtercola vilae]